MVCELMPETDVLAIEPIATRGEAALVAAAQRDPAAFAPLYEAYVAQVYRFAYRRVGSRAEAEDVTAQTFQQALAALPAYQWRGVPFGAWLTRIAANVIAQRGRRGGREVVVEDFDRYLYPDRSGLDDDPARLIEAEAEAGELLAAVRGLPLDQQRVLVLKFAHGQTNREIGEALGRSEGAIKQLAHRALVSLRQILASPDRGVDGAAGGWNLVPLVARR